MKKGCLTAILLSILVLIGGVVAGGFVLLTQRNVAVNLEEAIDAQYVDNQSNYDNMVKSAKEMVQVSDIYAEKFESIYKGLIEGRNQDTNLLFKVVHESNPNLDSTVYTTLQREISANRKTFDANQKSLTDKVREYNVYIRKNFIMAAITNRKPLDAKDYIVTSTDTNKAFESGEADAINLRGE